MAKNIIYSNFLIFVSFIKGKIFNYTIDLTPIMYQTKSFTRINSTELGNPIEKNFELKII
jgi:hypothetical protein